MEPCTSKLFHFPRTSPTLSVFFAIADTGAGIADDELKNLFQPFTQVSQGFTRNHQGAGLGLTISYSIIEKLGGHIHVTSKEGQGTTFHIALPIGV